MIWVDYYGMVDPFWKADGIKHTFRGPKRDQSWQVDVFEVKFSLFKLSLS